MIAHFWANLRWLYRGIGDWTMMSMAEEKTLEAYQQVYKECHLDPKQDQYVCIMLARPFSSSR